MSLHEIDSPRSLREHVTKGDKQYINDVIIIDGEKIDPLLEIIEPTDKDIRPLTDEKQVTTQARAAIEFSPTHHYFKMELNNADAVWDRLETEYINPTNIKLITSRYFVCKMLLYYMNFRYPHRYLKSFKAKLKETSDYDFIETEGCLQQLFLFVTPDKQYTTVEYSNSIAILKRNLLIYASNVYRIYFSYYYVAPQTPIEQSLLQKEYFIDMESYKNSSARLKEQLDGLTDVLKDRGFLNRLTLDKESVQQAVV